MECIRRLCCIKKKKIDEYESDDDFIPMPTPIIFPDEEPIPIPSSREVISSLYKRISSWSLPKSMHVNLFTLTESDLDAIDERDHYFDDVVDGSF